MWKYTNRILWVYCFVRKQAWNALELQMWDQFFFFFFFLCKFSTIITAPETHLWKTSSGEPVLFVQIPQKCKNNKEAALHFTVWIHLIQNVSQNKNMYQNVFILLDICKEETKQREIVRVWKRFKKNILPRFFVSQKKKKNHQTRECNIQLFHIQIDRRCESLLSMIGHCYWSRVPCF